VTVAYGPIQSCCIFLKICGPVCSAPVASHLRSALISSLIAMPMHSTGDDFDVLSNVHVAHATLRPALPRPVPHLLGNSQVLRVVLDRQGKVPQRLVRVP
jgi:hypothetical protein